MKTLFVVIIVNESRNALKSGKPRIIFVLKARQSDGAAEYKGLLSSTGMINIGKK